VCLLVQLLLVTCVSSLFHLTLAVTPTVTPPPLGSPSLSRGAVGQKKEREKKKKRKAIQKKEQKKRENPKEKRDRRTVQLGNGNRFVSVKEFCAVTIRHRFVLVEGVFLWSPAPFLPRHTVPLLLFSTIKLPYSELGLTFERERECAYGELLFEILCVHIISFWGILKKKLKKSEKK
jgi:hypothetical protein